MRTLPTTVIIILSSYFKILSSQCLCTTSNSHILPNPSFETGDSTGWTITPHPRAFDAMEILIAGSSRAFGDTTNPTDGSWSISNGWDGGPGSYILTSDMVSVPTCSGAGTSLMFEYGYHVRNDGSADRIFYVHILSCNGVTVLNTEVIQIIPPIGSAVSDYGVTANVDVSAYIDQNIIIRFEWMNPEGFTGAGFAELDNIRFVNSITLNTCTYLNCRTFNPTKSP
eukprot:73168_1